MHEPASVQAREPRPGAPSAPPAPGDAPAGDPRGAPRGARPGPPRSGDLFAAARAASTPGAASAAPRARVPEGPLDLDGGLRRLGYDAFRPGQREAVETLLSERRLLLVAPTGGGKSLIYQLPGSLLPGTTLVVSPLIALMNDQVSALTARGVAATFLASTLDAGEIRTRMAQIARGEYALVYVAPERLVHPGFRALLRDLDVPLIAVDEAHCISEWGHDFRPEYGAIGALLDEVSGARVLACTATATPVVRDEILEKLHLPAGTTQLVRGFARPNLALAVREAPSANDRRRAVDAALAMALETAVDPKGTAIIYSPTRRATEEEADRLVERGWRAGGYHAGMSADERERVQRGFIDGELTVVVATNAFGMGIDRADVRLVVHLAPPSSIESYYQEVGRAGRDGEPADGLLLMGPNDLALRRNLIERDSGDVENDGIGKHKWNLFLELMRWAEGGSCRHDAILRYFGDEDETLAGCGRCDVCRAVDEGEGDADETALVVRKALSGVARVHGRYGMQLAAKLLRGAPDDRLARSGLVAVSTYGVLRERDEDWIVRLLRRCVTAGWVDFRGGDRPVVVLTEEGKDVMSGKRPARLLLPSERVERASRDDGGRRGKRGRRSASSGFGGGGGGFGEARASGGGRRKTSAADTELVDFEARERFEALRRHRLALAKAQSVPPYVVASDRTLRDMANRFPTSLHELEQVHGIGPSKAERYGQGFLDVLAGREPVIEDGDAGDAGGDDAPAE
ncbi:MAG: ATP-dependent DNA helicase RecQ [Planctomycetes bacterium]|nr:ATP-dependent DNA helicase RecQ [Planctomycetota bacterium]